MNTDVDPKKQCAYRKACKPFFALWTRTNILKWKHDNEQIF